MAYKKIDKEFVMSTSSENVYGFRLLTSGYRMGDFTKNPIGYYMHKKDEGVLVKWEDVRLDGDQVKGKPCINLEHPRGERTATEVEEGFLNAASVGGIVVLKSELADNPNDPNDPILVVTEWYNKECSLVDNPGNREAMKVVLYDVNDKVMDLADMTDTLKRASNMKIVQIPVAEVIELLNLSDDATTEQVVAGIKELKKTAEEQAAKVTELSDTLNAERKSVLDAKVKAILEKGLDDEKITVAESKVYARKFADDPEELQSLMDAKPKYEPIGTRLQAHVDPKVKDLMDNNRGYDYMDKNELTAHVKRVAPDVYRQLYMEKFGKEPKE